MTTIVETSEMTIIAVRKLCISFHFSSSPTVAGMNIIGNICTRKWAVSFTAGNFIAPVHNAVNSITMPYMLAGMGSGIMWLSNSPMSEMARMIVN